MVRPPPRSDLTDLVRNTVIWIAAVLWLTIGFVFQTPPAGPYSETVVKAFAAVLAIVVPLVSVFIAIAWVIVLRGRR
jgi:uncharacterized membrane protein YozB (DUF420 family)